MTVADRAPRPKAGERFEAAGVTALAVTPAPVPGSAAAKVLGRGGLDLRERELCIVAMLMVLDTPRQLYVHLRGALSTGAIEAEAEEALREAFRYAAAPARKRVWAVWERVRQGALGS